MSQNKVKFFLTGATGYIGGSVFSQLLKHPQRDAFEFTALVRSPEKAEKLKQFGVKSVIGSLEDSELLTKHASQADVVFSSADADHVGSLNAILKGQKKYHERTGIRPILIHTSGVGVFADTAYGMYASTEIYSDLDVKKFEKLPATQPHRRVELAILEGDKEGYVRTYIVSPATIWGIADHDLVKAGASKPFSQQVPALIQASLDRKRGGMVGEGKNIWHNVEIGELATLYSTLYDAIESKNEKATHGNEGIYIAENGEHTLYQVAKAIQEALVELGISKETEPTSFTNEEFKKYIGDADFLGINARCKAERPRMIGWKPAQTTKDFLAGIKTEVEVLKKKKEDVTPSK